MVKPGAVSEGGVVIDRLPRNRVVRHDLARRVEDGGSPAVDRARRAFRISAIEIDAEPLAESGAVGRDVEAGARRARSPRLFVDVDSGEQACLLEG